jgi:hypothetical protein
MKKVISLKLLKKLKPLIVLYWFFIQKTGIDSSLILHYFIRFFNLVFKMQVIVKSTFQFVYFCFKYVLNMFQQRANKTFIL